MSLRGAVNCGMTIALSMPSAVGLSMVLVFQAAASTAYTYTAAAAAMTYSTACSVNEQYDITGKASPPSFWCPATALGNQCALLMVPCVGIECVLSGHLSF